MDLNSKVKLSAQRAFSGAYSKYLKGITFKCDNSLLLLRAYFEDRASPDDIELINVGLSEIMADMWQEIAQCQYQPVMLSEDQEMEGLTTWIYKRQ